jgi:hypothetical protein
MTRARSALVLLAIGAGLGVAGAGPVLAQGRVVVPIIIAPRPSGAGNAVTDRRIVVQPGATVAGSGRTPSIGAPSAGASVPAVTQEIRIISHPPTSQPPSGGGGTPTTRITVDQLPGSAGMSSPRASQGFASVPAFSRETHVTVEQDNGRATLGTRQEIVILSNGDIETPLIVLSE